MAARGSRAIEATMRGCAVFLVTLRFNGQPDWTAGEYATREAAAHAAAELYVTDGPGGERPIGVGVMRTHTPHGPKAPIRPLPPRLDNR
jgi:hypothetical protein